MMRGYLARLSDFRLSFLRYRWSIIVVLLFSLFVFFLIYGSLSFLLRQRHCC